MPAIEIALSVLCLVLVGLRRRALSTKAAGDVQDPSRLTQYAQRRFANPAGAKLTLPFIPMVGIALVLSAPLLLRPNGRSSFVWGLALLFWMTLVAIVVFPDPVDLDELVGPPLTQRPLAAARQPFSAPIVKPAMKYRCSAK